MNKITLTVGDWSDDGHGKVATYTFEHNLTRHGLREAYRQGSLLLGIKRKYYDYMKCGVVVTDVVLEDALEQVAAEYEDSSMPSDLAEALIANGIVPNHFDEATSTWANESEMFEEGDPGDYMVSGTEGFANLWMKIARLGNTSLVYNSVELDNITIGGYGLFN